jgi:thioredoxin reductase (NADPH)
VTDRSAEDVAFPELTDEQLALVSALGERRRVRAGEILFSPDDDHYDWVVVLSGAVEVVGAHDQLITRQDARHFLGEVSLVTRQRPYLSTRVAEAGEVLIVPADVFRSKVLTDPRLSDTVLEAFLARRATLLSTAAESLQIIGSAFTPASMALREYAARNRLPHRWIDADAHADVDALLSGLGVTAADLPIVITERALLKRATPG